jgi:parallel beta-helix repeat protein
MKLENLNMKTKFTMAMILFIAVISISFVSVEPVSAATINVQPSSYYNTGHTSLNDQIQNIINSAKNGDTLNFLGKSYGNLSLVIDKSLNIISRVNTTVSGDSTGQPVFLVKGSGSRWTNITGFNIKSVNDGISVQNAYNITISKNSVSSSKGTGIKVSNSNGVKVIKNNITSSQTGISVSNTKNSNVQGNKVKKSVKNGVEIQKCHDIKLVNNTVSSSGKDGALIANSQNIDVETNDMESSQNNGINLINTNHVDVNNNTIRYNKLNGIYFDKNVINTIITLNKINHNHYGIELWNSGSYTKINSNILDWNFMGIDVNSKSDHLNISQNIITNSKKYEGSSEGVGINIGSGYEGSSTFTVSDNAIYGSGKWEIDAVDSALTSIDIGYNWYGSDNPNDVRVCHKVAKNLITWELVNSFGVYSAIFMGEGTQFATGLSGFDVTFQMNNGTTVTVTVKNGTATYSFPSSQYSKKENKVTVKATYQTKHQTVSAVLSKNIVDYQDQNGNGGGDTPGGGGGDTPGGGGGDTPGGGGGTPGGGGGTPGDNNGKSGQSGSTSTTDTGSNNIQKNSAMLDGSGQSAQSSAGQSQTSQKKSKTAQEVLMDTVNNPNLWSIVGLMLLIVATVVIYYRKEIEMMYKKKK